MILFDLKCTGDHVFEAWFPDSDSFEAQAANDEIACPVCGDTEIAKALMAPNVSGAKKAGEAPQDKAAMHMGEYMSALAELRKHVEANCDDVGDKFPEEARKIHYGETEKRNIYGEASTEEAAELRDEGVEVQPIPWSKRSDS